MEFATVGSLDAWLSPSFSLEARDCWSAASRFTLSSHTGTSCSRTSPIEIPKKPQKGHAAVAPICNAGVDYDEEAPDCLGKGNRASETRAHKTTLAGKVNLVIDIDSDTGSKPASGDQLGSAAFSACVGGRLQPSAPTQQPRRGMLSELLGPNLQCLQGKAEPLTPSASLPVQATHAPVSLASLCTALSTPAASKETSLAASKAGHKPPPLAAAGPASVTCDSTTASDTVAFERSMLGPPSSYFRPQSWAFGGYCNLSAAWESP